jgi:hypothetical protein
MHEKSFDRFIFSIKNEDIQFNFNILMNILYIDIKIENENKSILHWMNEATRFQMNKWLKEISAKHVWDQLRACWIDIYLRSFNVIIIDANKQFVIRQHSSLLFSFFIFHLFHFFICFIHLISHFLYSRQCIVFDVWNNNIIIIIHFKFKINI